MNWLFENPLPIVLGTGLLVLVFVAAMIKIGKWRFIYLAIGAIVLGAILLVAERRIVTPYEEIQAKLDEISTDLASNNAESVVRHISDVAPRIQHEARAKLRIVDIEQVKIKSNLKVIFAETRGQQVAEATFNAVGYVRAKAGQERSRPYPKFVTLNFRREGNEWKISDYKLDDAREGIRGK